MMISQSQGIAYWRSIKASLVCVTAANVFFLALLVIDSAVWKRFKITNNDSIYFILTLLFLDIVLTRYFLNMVFNQDIIFVVIDMLRIDSYACLKLGMVWIILIGLAVWITSLNNFKCYSRTWKRKIFHLLVVLMFATPLLDRKLDAFLIFAFGVALSAFILLEAIRCNQTCLSTFQWLEDINRYFKHFECDNLYNLTAPPSFVNSHINLLLACAIPIWIWGLLMATLLTYSESLSGSSSLPRICGLLPHLGYVTVGIGDSMAALVGTSLGRNRWPGKRKTIEGSLAAFASIYLSLFIILLCLIIRQPISTEFLVIAAENKSINTPLTLSHLLHIIHTVSTSEYVTLFFVSLTTALVEVTATIDDNIAMPLTAIVTLLLCSLLLNDKL